MADNKNDKKTVKSENVEKKVSNKKKEKKSVAIY